MSEYQYYEFQAIDRRLSPQEMATLRALSSRAHITPTSFTNFYNWGDFKGDPKALVEQYFDAFLYLANWGTRRLMLRLPSRLLNLETASRYCPGGSASAWASGEHVIVEFTSDRESAGVSGEEWDPEEDETGEDWLSAILPVRGELARGDYRCLYLGWLRCAMVGELEEDAVEPPVPAGLGRLSGALEEMARFLRVDPDLIAVAAERSPDMGAVLPAEHAMAAWVARLPVQEKDELLLRLLRGDIHVGHELFQRARRELGAADGRLNKGGDTPRTVSELLARAEARRAARLREQAERERKERERRAREEAARRARYLAQLANREEQAWQQVEELIATRRPGFYDQAVELLRDLRDACAQAGRADAFGSRLQSLRARHARKDTFIRRLEQAGL